MTARTADFDTIPVRDLTPEDLTGLSERMKLSLSGEDMLAIQAQFRDLARDPTDVELEVIAQTWSEHCKHRIFNADIRHQGPRGAERVDSLFKTFVRGVTEPIMEARPDFVLSAFHDNAGFIRLDDDTAICLKLETHNHPSAIEPYAGANTGLGGVIRDILGAGKGARPVASLDVFCFGRPDTPPEQVTGDLIHPLGVFRGVVRGVRDYGNRMGIPTVGGAIQFADGYLHNPLVFCGTAGTIPIADIPKKVEPGMLVVAVGGRTGRDGLHGATFSSAALDTDSHEEDKGAVQIGNPIEEKKVTDMVLQARAEGLIGFITDCGAGGFSSAAGEMLSELGGEIQLENCPLKEPGLRSWEIFLSESQERMVLAIRHEHWNRVRELARIYETEATVIGRATGDGRLRVVHHGQVVCDLDGGFLHEAPRKRLTSTYRPARAAPVALPDAGEAPALLRALLADVNLCSREPVIREYDHEVQGNTVNKPLAGPDGRCPQDGAVIRVDGTGRFMALGVSLLPSFGERDAYRMGLSTVDEAVRQVVAAGADPDQVALLDNFCAGDPTQPDELGKLVETARGMAEAARAYGTPFISGKDSFYNCYDTEQGTVNIPLTLLVSALARIDDPAWITPASLRGPGNLLVMLGATAAELGGSALARHLGQNAGTVPTLDPPTVREAYRRFHQAVRQGLVQSAHDLSEGGLAVAAAEAGFSLRAGVEIDLDAVPGARGLEALETLFSESNGRILFEVRPEDEAALREILDDSPWAVVGRTTEGEARLVFSRGGQTVLADSLSDLKDAWTCGLTPYY